MNSPHRNLPIPFRAFILMGLLLINQTLFAQLSGTLTVDPSGGGDYLTITDAVADLNSQGINGPLTFNIKPGTYDEQVWIGPYPGASESNRVIFQAEPVDSGDVILAYTYPGTASGGIINFDSAAYITVQRLAFDATRGYFDQTVALRFSGTANNINIQGNVFTGKKYSGATWGRTLIYADYGAQNDILIENNHFTSCNHYINFRGHDWDSLSTGLVIRGNYFDNSSYNAIGLLYCNAPVVENNVFSGSSYFSGIILQNIVNGFAIRKNRMELGIRSGIFMEYISAGDNPGIIANNFITNTTVAGGSTGIVLGESTNNVRIYHNSILISDDSDEGTGVCITTGTSGSDIDIQNNICANMAGGLIYYIQNPDILSVSDYNNYFTTGDRIALWDETDLNSVQDLVAMGPGDEHSLSVYPGFFSDSDLHTTSFLLDNKGNNLSAFVPTDIDGEPRSTTPDIGADEFTGTGAPLAGDYTIGGIGADYLNIGDAVFDLNQYGISAPVRLLVREDDSPYNEQITFLPIMGADADTRVTLMPHPDNENPVELTCDHTSTINNYILNILGAKYLTVRDLRFIWLDYDGGRNMFQLSGDCSYDSIVNCRFNNYSGSSYMKDAIHCTSGRVLTGMVIKSCLFSGGYTGIRIESPDENYISGFSIDSNRIYNQFNYGIYLDGCKKFTIHENEILKTDAAHQYADAILIQNCAEGFQVTGNIIKQRGRRGIHLVYTTADPAEPGIIANNYSFFADEQYQLISIDCYYSRYIGIYFNTVSRELARGEYVHYPLILTGGGNLSIKNNIFCNAGTGGVAVGAEAGLLSDFSHNTVFSAGNTLINYDGKDYISLADLESDLGKALNCLTLNTTHPEPGDFHALSSILDGAGIPIAGITHDLDGEVRSDPPDIGADEFTPEKPPLPAGTYTVGGQDPDYISFSAMFDDLQLRGISGPVVFKVRKDVYPEILGTVYHISGSSAQNTVTIESETGNPEDVLLYANVAPAPAILNLVLMSYTTIKDITISTQSFAGNAVNITGGTNDLNFIGCVFQSTVYLSNLVNVAARSNSLVLRENVFTGGNTGINIGGLSSEPSEQTRVINNIFNTTGSYGIIMQYQYSPQILGNEIINELTGTGPIGIDLTECNDSVLISGNKINHMNLGFAILLRNCVAALPHRILIANNQIHMGGIQGLTSRGVGIGYCERMGIYYNSIHITGPDTSSSSGIYIAGGNTGINVVNNIVSNSGGGYAYHVNDAADVFTSDHNNYYTTGTDLALWETTEVQGISELKAVSGKEANSRSLDPLFVSDSDLHSNELALNEKGTPLIEVTYDIDSLRRDPVKPDLGAFENTCGTPDFDITFISGCLGDTTIFIDHTTGMDPGSTIEWDWTGDYVPEPYIERNDTVKHLFTEPGIHTVHYIVTQLSGECIDTKEIRVEVFEPPELFVETTGVYCDTNGGSASVSVLNGEGPFEYYWSTDSTEASVSKLDIGYYTVTVTDSNNCLNSKEIHIGEAIEVEVEQLQASTCGNADGIAQVTASGGYPPYRYMWSDGDTLATDSSLEAGQHFVNVTDANGCYARGSVTIENAGNGPQITGYEITNVKCHGKRSGAININVSGGTGSYEYRWSNGSQSKDIDNLAVGIYNVTIEDDNECIGSGSFEVTQPLPLSVVTAIDTASCDNYDGKAAALTSGGTRPYKYMWSDGSSRQVATGFQAGIYTVTVRDSNNCTVTEPLIINNIDGPKIGFEKIKGVGCMTTDNGEIQITVEGQGPYTFEWSNGETTPNLTGLSPDTFQIKVTDINGCTGFNQAVITQAPPPVNPICLVTVDSATQRNMVVWEKIVTEDVSHYNIYHEISVTNQYQLIGSVGLNELSQYIDSIADPNKRSWRYRLSVVDVCGNESDLSDPHKTIHLTKNLGVDSVVNLIWDQYEGFPVEQYLIRRYDAQTGLTPLAEMPGNYWTLTDENPPFEDLTYYIEVVHPYRCTITDKKASTHNSSRSNRITRLKSDVGGTENLQDVAGLRIYPNPGTGLYNLRMDLDGASKVSVKVSDISGKIVFIEDYENVPHLFETQFDLTGNAEGIYIIQVRTSNALLHRILIKE